MLFVVYALLIGGAQILLWIYPNTLVPTEVRGGRSNKVRLTSSSLDEITSAAPVLGK